MGSDCVAAIAHYGLSVICCEECHDEVEFGGADWYDVFDGTLTWHLCCETKCAVIEYLSEE